MENCPKCVKSGSGEFASWTHITIDNTCPLCNGKGSLDWIDVIKKAYELDMFKRNNCYGERMSKM